MPYKDKTEQREYQQRWLAQRRANYLSDKCCASCGSTTELQIDHIDPAQKVTHKIWSWAQPRREEELAKCQILCVECHKRKTIDNGENTKGEAIGNSILTELIVNRARKDYSTGLYTFKDLESKYGYKAETIRYAVKRGGWKHI